MTSTSINTVPAASSTFLADLQTFLLEEDADRFRDMFTGFISVGGTHATGAGLVHTPASLTAYPGGHYITETGAITYPDSTTHIWVICHKDTTTAVTDWTRVSGTHYLFRNTGSAVLPALPVVESAILMKVTTAGGAVSVVEDHRTRSPEVLSRTVKMTNIDRGVWRVVGANGGEVDISSSTTDGLQEAIDEAALNASHLYVEGAGFVSGGTDISLITCTTPITFPAMHGQTIRFSWCTIQFTSAVTGDGMTFDSCMMVDAQLPQITYAGTSSAVHFKPTNPDPKDGVTAVIDSRFVIITLAYGQTTVPTEGVKITPPFKRCFFEIGELNATSAASNGITVVPPVSPQEFSLNMMRISAHSISGKVFDMASGASSAESARTSSNHIILNYQDGGAAADVVIDIGGRNNIIDLLIRGTGINLGVDFSTQASENYVRAPGNEATNAVTDSSSGKNRYDEGRDLFIGKVKTDTTVAGMELRENAFFSVTRAARCALFNRLTTDGELVVFEQDDTQEGAIDVNGTTVGYLTFTGGHWSQWWSGHDGTIPPSGTVLATTDESYEREIVEWLEPQAGPPKKRTERRLQRGAPHPDEPPEAIVKDAPKPNLVKCKISNVSNDPRVYGVFSHIGENGDVVVYALGTALVRVIGPCEGGDLLISNGDGTAVKNNSANMRTCIGKLSKGSPQAKVREENLLPCVLYSG